MGKGIDMKGVRKFGAKELGPLYCSLAIEYKGKNLVILGGGAGNMSSGIKNRLVVTMITEDSVLGDPIVNIEVGDELPTRLAFHPDGSVLAVFCTGPRVFKLEMKKDEEGKELVVGGLEEQKELAAKLSGFGEVKCAAFSHDQSLLALGAEDGHLRVLSWPALKVLWECAPVPSERGEKLDREKPGHTQGITEVVWAEQDASLASVSRERAGPHSGAIVWGVEKQGAKVTLTHSGYLWGKLADLKFMGGFRGLAFSSAAQGTIFAGFNNNGRMKGPDSYLCEFDASSLALKKHGMCMKEGKITSLALSANDRFIATGTSEGDAAVHNSSLQAMVKVCPSHLTFTTSVCFSTDSSTAVSTSADGSSRCIVVPAKPMKSAALVALLHFLVLVIAIVAGYVYYDPALRTQALGLLEQLKQ